MCTNDTDEPQAARQRVAEMIGLLVNVYGSQTRLAQELISNDENIPGLNRAIVSAWVDARALPPEATANMIAMLLGDRSKLFLDEWQKAQHEDSTGQLLSSSSEASRATSVLGIVWLGARAENLDEMCHFYGEVMRLHPVHRCDNDHAIFRTDNGDYVALFGPSADRYALFRAGPVAGFRVGNIVAARAEMEARGTTFLSPTLAQDNGRWKFAHYLAPDGHIYELVEETPWPER